MGMGLGDVSLKQCDCGESFLKPRKMPEKCRGCRYEATAFGWSAPDGWTARMASDAERAKYNVLSGGMIVRSEDRPWHDQHV